MRFAHLADCHIGSWRDPKLRDLSTRAFIKAIDAATDKQVDFIIIAGDLFNTSFPRLDNLKTVVQKLREMQAKDVPVYIVPGSHDYSPSGKTMLDILEEAGLFINVFKGEVRDNKLHLRFTEDKKTGIKIAGMLGKMGALERTYYENLDKGHLESEEGKKIFIFHSGLQEFKPKGMENVDLHPLSLLPKGFDYYAGGHVHEVSLREEKDYGQIAYPGPLFPNSFSELEKLERGGFYIVEDWKAQWHPIQIHNTCSLKVDCTHKSPDLVKEELLGQIKDREFNDTIVLIRLYGTLETGKPSDLDLRDIFQLLYDKSAYFVMKNAAAVQSKEFEEIAVDAASAEKVEETLIREHLGQMPVEGISDKEKQIITQLMESLTSEKNEGETQADFSRRIRRDAGKILNLDLDNSN